MIDQICVLCNGCRVPPRDYIPRPGARLCVYAQHAGIHAICNLEIFPDEAKQIIQGRKGARKEEIGKKCLWTQKDNSQR